MVFDHRHVMTSDSVPSCSGPRILHINLLRLCNLRCLRVSAKHAEAVSSVVWASKTSDFFLSGCKNGVVSLFDTRSICNDDLTSNTEEYLQASLHAVVHTKDINSIAVSPDDLLVATGSQDRTIKVRGK